MVSAPTRRAVHVLGGLYRMQERVAGNESKKTGKFGKYVR